jgi:hypothetical protein
MGSAKLAKTMKRGKQLIGRKDGMSLEICVVSTEEKMDTTIV